MPLGSATIKKETERERLTAHHEPEGSIRLAVNQFRSCFLSFFVDQEPNVVTNYNYWTQPREDSIGC